ncbi:MAG TPA: PAS domain S-box protein [Vicinamibacterales bacterium]|nr:PAS domain S-box protein [Vicinamibacterales bacterium]
MGPLRDRFDGSLPRWAQPGASTLTSRYAVALAVFGGAVLFRYVFEDSLGFKVPFLHFYPAVMLAAWYGGLGPGILITTLSAVAAMYFLLPPSGIAVGDSADQLSLGVFVVTGVVISWLNHRLHTTQEAQRSATATATARAERLDAILNMTVDGIILIDAKGRIEAFNRGAQDLFGYAEDEVLGRNVSILMPSPYHEQHDSYLERYLRTGEARIIGIGREVTGRRRDGSVFPVQLSVGEMQINGERKFTGMLRDLTKRVDLEGALGASEARWRAIIDSAVDGIIVIDAHGRVEGFNRAAERLFGYTIDEVLGRNVDMLMPSPYRAEHDTYLSRYLATGHAKIIGIGREVQGLRKDGTTFPLHLSVGEITIGGQRKFTGILHDLTRRVQMEGQLRERDALARLGEMAAVIAHEVKNPLAGIRGAIQVFGGRMIQEGANTQILNEIVARIDSLDQMMKDLLLFARPPAPRRSPIDMVPLVRATASLLSEDPALRDIDVHVDGGALLVFADPDMLKVVFQNLLINSAHAMQGKGSIRIAVELIDTTCQIAFADGGPGIPADIRQKIFTPFFTTKSRGSGLGLPTVKRFVEAHSGEIAIDCPPGGGTTVLIRLPMGRGGSQQPALH